MLAVVDNAPILFQTLKSVLAQPDKTIVPDRNARIYVYGAGSYGHRVGSALQACGYHQITYVDDKAVGREVNGKSVADSGILTQTNRDDWLLLAVLNRDVDLAALSNRLASIGPARQQTPPQFVNWLDAPELHDFWLTTRAGYVAMAREILEGTALWADEGSRLRYLHLWLYRLTGDIRWLDTPDMSNQYLPEDLLPGIDFREFVDCGAYDGDTLRALMRSGYKPSRWYAFEPDPGNFHLLQAFIANDRKNLGDVQCWPCGVWSSNAQLRFSSERGEASAFNDEGDALIQCVALDQALPNAAPDYIKMDVEGAELQALMGAGRLLHMRPALAISAYHRPEDLYRIANYLDSLTLDYRFHLHLHGHQCFDTVLYAIATEKEF